MKLFKWLGLQLFAEGEGGDGAATGVTPAAAGEDTDSVLRGLGVPEDKLAKNRAKRAKTAKAETPTEVAPQQAAAAENTEADPPEEKPARMTWEEVKADPEYNAEMQKMMQERVKKSKEAETKLEKLTPALEVLARKHHLDIDNLDYDALAKAVNDDDNNYEDIALEMGVSVTTAKEIDQGKREQERQQKTLEEQKMHEHVQKLMEQGETMRKAFPKFDLRVELENETFRRLTSPGVGLSVEDAYHAIHRREIQAAALEAATQQTAKMLSNSIQAGQRRPAEAGSTAQAASVTTFDYKKASAAERNDLKARIRAAAARGEKIYPGR